MDEPFTIVDPTSFPMVGLDSPAEPTVAVLARAGWPPDRAGIEAAQRLGEVLATHGFVVASTGYGELLAAVARRAVVAGGRTLGLPVRDWPIEPIP